MAGTMRRDVYYKKLFTEICEKYNDVFLCKNVYDNSRGFKICFHNFSGYCVSFSKGKLQIGGRPQSKIFVHNILIPKKNESKFNVEKYIKGILNHFKIDKILKEIEELKQEFE